MNIVRVSTRTQEQHNLSVFIEEQWAGGIDSEMMRTASGVLTGPAKARLAYRILSGAGWESEVWGEKAGWYTGEQEARAGEGGRPVGLSGLASRGMI